jgi:hypothetical protein
LLPVARYPFSDTVPLTDAPVPPVGIATEPITLPEVKKLMVPVGGPPAVVPVTVKLTVAAVEYEVAGVAVAVVVVAIPDGAVTVIVASPEVAA